MKRETEMQSAGRATVLGSWKQKLLLAPLNTTRQRNVGTAAT